MKKLLRILPLLAVFGVPVYAQPQANATRQPQNPKPGSQIDPKAVALLDRAAKHYQSVRSLKLVAQGSMSWEGETMPAQTELFFERPNKIRVRGKTDGFKGVFVANGQTVFSWDDLTGTWTRPQNDRYTQPWRNSMATTDFLVGSYLAKWLFGQHWLRPLQSDPLLMDADTFKARALPAKTVNGALAQGVTLLATKAASGKNPKFTAQQTMWFRNDGRLVRAELVNHIGTKIKRGAVNVVGERANLTLPASTWLLKK